MVTWGQRGVGKGGIEKRSTGKLFEMTDMFIILIVMKVSQPIHMSKPLKLYSLNTCTILYVSYTSIKLLKIAKC